jgi:NAD+ diphosphatase
MSLGFTGFDYDRASAIREDEVKLAALRQEPSSKTYLLFKDEIFIKDNNPLFKINEEGVFLGLFAGQARFATALTEKEASELKTYGYLTNDLRSLAVQNIMDEAHLAALASAKSLFHWHNTHKYCGSCGGETRMKKAGFQRDCPKCEAQHFPRTDPVVIMLPVKGDMCLMGRQARFPQGTYSALAGFMEPGESVEMAVKREIQEEVGIETGDVKLILNQPWPFPASLMLGCMAQATSQTLNIDYLELEDARWFSKEDCHMMLAKTHPQGFIAPPPLAIAHHLIKAFLDDK